MIVGIDEVGRGSWAGPLCVGAVALGDTFVDGLTDSKKLTARKRTRIDREIRQQAAGVGLGWVSARQIDEIGLSEALKLAARRALAQVSVTYDQIIVDGTIRLIDDPRAVTMKQADLLVPCVSAASVVAKVARDSYMAIMEKRFPEYGFEAHVGYGTAAHTAALRELGPSAIHRMSFAPLKARGIAEAKPRIPTSGQRAETAAGEYLRKNRFTIIARNWKTKWCEIDIIAEKRGVIHFIEVKYRADERHGTALEMITPGKLRQVRFAAEVWLAGKKDNDRAVLSVVEVGGPNFQVSEFIESL